MLHSQNTHMNLIHNMLGYQTYKMIINALTHPNPTHSYLNKFKVTLFYKLLGNPWLPN